MTYKPRTILGVFSHPDDESMGPGGTLAKYAAQGHRVIFVTATDGGAGRLFDERPGDAGELRALRRRETLKAARVLGIEFLGFLGWHDGRLKESNILDIETRIAEIIRRERPDVLVTFHGSGISYHADHRVTALALQGAFLGAGRRGWYTDAAAEALAPHSPSRFYFYTLRRSVIEKVEWPRLVYASPEDEITTVVDTSEFAEVKWRAIQAHESQQEGPPFRLLYDAGMFAQECFVRVFPSRRPGDPIETSLIEDAPPR